ncbi:MAG: DUF1553 domain-containing protein [Ginsengibacter sp.]
MTFKKNKKLLSVVSILIVAILAFTFNSSRQVIDFSTQVKPILNKNCITCHGGVRRQSNYSLLFRSDALAKAKSGKFAIVPGDPDHSEMMRRLTVKDPEERMPFKHQPLPEDQINILRKWIKQGAQWGDHWAYVPVKQEPVPKPKNSFFGLIPAKKIDWVKNDIDFFIYEKLQEEKLKPSEEADKATLLRRVSLDLTGLPPSEKIAGQFLQNNRDNAYETLVDSLLASPRYGEHFTAMWLDLARYADTKGYEADRGRRIWEYRDWLIKAFNSDKPYDQFLIEQLAGDLFPNATDDQFVATAFNRNTLTNDEGGTDNEEFRTAAVLDRVNTTWQALMGTTFSCVQCHSHPYDPFRHEDYYKFMAFFNDTRDEDTNEDYPLLRKFNTEDSLKLFKVTNWLKENNSEEEAKRVYIFLKTWQPAINSLLADKCVNSEISSSWWLVLRNNALARLKSVSLEQKSELIFRYTGYVEGGTWTIHLDEPDGPVLKKIFVEKTKVWKITSIDFPVASGVHDLFFTYSNPNLKKPDENGMLFDWFYFTNPLEEKDKKGYAEINKLFWELLNAPVATTPVMMDNPKDMHRTTYVFEKGSWLVKGEKVSPDVPGSLNPFPKNAPRNRLGLAKWLTSKQNPLTARTMVNRLWEQLFGTGLVETLEDMGTQGALPTHRELLDYLAWNFMNTDNWSTKKLLKRIVMSATYRQDAKVSKENLERDPSNKWYARAPRVRLSAEQIRDQALAVSGLLSEKMYGPGVMPWQPEGIWKSPYNGLAWTKSEGEDQYRRSLYTYWKRTAPYPSMMTFDAASREVCTARRIRTNTPLQALVTLNDSVYLDASRHFAYRMKDETKSNEANVWISKGYELAMLKPISESKLKALVKLYDKAYRQFKNDKEKMNDIVSDNSPQRNNPETAALVVVASAILNLDELITKN